MNCAFVMCTCTDLSNLSCVPYILLGFPVVYAEKFFSFLEVHIVEYVYAQA